MVNRGGDGSEGQDAKEEGDPDEKTVVHKNEDSSWFLFLNTSKEITTLYSSKWEGTKGKDGAKGGAGGQGGSEGGIQIVTCTNYDGQIYKSCDKGANGRAGVGGKGGKGGQNKLIFSTVKDKSGFLSAFLPPLPPLLHPERNNNNAENVVNTKTDFADAGKDCTELSYEGLIKAEPSRPINNSDEILREYKEFIHNSLNDKYRSENLKNMVSKYLD